MDVLSLARNALEGLAALLSQNVNPHVSAEPGPGEVLRQRGTAALLR